MQEVGTTDLILDDLLRLKSRGSTLTADAPRYFRYSNRYDSGAGLLEYGISLVEFIPLSGLTLAPNRELTLGRINIRGVRAGQTELAADLTDPDSLEIVTMDDSGSLTTIPLDTYYSPLVINVRPEGERVYLEGRIWPSRSVQADDDYLPLADFTLEIWAARNGADSGYEIDAPLARFTNLKTDKKRLFTIRDLPEQISGGVYDLRLHSDEFLTGIASNVEIDLADSASGVIRFPGRLKVEFGPLISGDLSGDDRIDDADLAIVESHFGELTEPDADPASSDLNGDGVTDGQDFSLLAVNYDAAAR